MENNPPTIKHRRVIIINTNSWFVITKKYFFFLDLASTGQHFIQQDSILCNHVSSGKTKIMRTSFGKTTIYQMFIFGQMQIGVKSGQRNMNENSNVLYVGIDTELVCF